MREARAQVAATTLSTGLEARLGTAAGLHHGALGRFMVLVAEASRVY